jgi:ABC-type Fe3+ transport system permease subunit
VTRGLVLMLLAVPAPVAAISLLEIVNQPGWFAAVADSGAIVPWAWSMRFAPIAALLVMPAVMRIPSAVSDAARVDGCGAAGLLVHVVWPGCRASVAVTILVLLVLCFGEIINAHMLAPPGWPLAAVRAFQMLHYGLYADLAVLGLLGAACTVVVWAGLLALLRAIERRKTTEVRE